MSKAPVSMCIITKKDPHIEECIKSFVDYVEEICIVINDPSDLESGKVAEKYNAKYKYITDCNDSEGRINNFSLARNQRGSNGAESRSPPRREGR